MADPVSIGAAAATTLTAGIIGNLIGARIARQVAKEAEDRRAERERQTELVRAGAAAELLRGELRVVRLALDWAIQHGEWKREGLPLPTAAWRAHGDLLLRHVGTMGATVSWTLAGVATMHELMLEVLGDTERAQLGPSMLNSVREMHENVLVVDREIAEVSRRAHADGRQAEPAG